MSNITGIIKSIRDIMRKDTGVDGDAQRISQMVWMIFMKIFADKEEEWSITLDDYESPLPKYLKWQSWAADDEGDTGDKLMEFINNSLFPTLKELDPSLGPQAAIIRSVFEDTYNYMKNGTLFRQVINEINKIDFNDQKERHLFNDLYETILKELQSAGSSGEYYTPRGVTKFMVDIINPKKGESILDPACGTGGFLINSINHIRENSKNYQPAEIQGQIRGIEKKPLPHLLCTTNLMLNGFDVPAVRRDNYLSKPYSDWGSKDKVDIILTNPPFGGVEEDGTETNFPQKFRTKETADLFLALIIRLLKDGGRAAVVLPDGTLFGEGIKTRLKEELLTRCNLHTIVRLPNGVFNPYTSIRTNILFFDKGISTNEIWYYEHPYPKGAKSYNKSNPISFKEFRAEKEWWNNRRENSQAWKVSIDEIIKRNYNLDIKNPYQKADNLDSPAVILDRIQESSEIINSHQKKIIDVFNNALNGEKAWNDLKPNFINYFKTAESINELKNAIYQLAIKGKLTKEWRNDNPNLETAQALLNKIKEAKTELIRSKKIRKEKELPPLNITDQLFSLPSTWVYERLGNIGDWGAGATPKRSEPEYYNGTINWFKSGELNNGVIDFDSKEKITELAISKSSVRLNQPGDILIAMYGATIGKTARLEVEGTTNQAVCACTCYEGMHNKYLHLLLIALKPTFTDQGEGGAQPNISRIKIRLQPFPLPPLEEQKAIVHIVNKLIEHCVILKNEIKKEETLSKSFTLSSLSEILKSN